MEIINVLRKTAILKDFIKPRFSRKVFMPELYRINPALEKIRSEIGEDFIQYLHRLQLEEEPNIMSLSSTHHYYYDSDDLKTIKVLINLKPLNSIKNLESFLRIMVRILPHKSNFIGYFKNDTVNRSDFSFYYSTRFFNGMINYFDSRTDNSLTKKEVVELLEEYKLNVVDITDINGMTYFCSMNT
jgi:hypothetical protein